MFGKIGPFNFHLFLLGILSSEKVLKYVTPF
jgi:hypothetical protein